MSTSSGYHGANFLINSPPDGYTLEVDSAFGTTTILYAAGFARNPFTKSIRHVNLLQTVDEVAFGYQLPYDIMHQTKKISIQDSFMALYLTILRRDCPHVETLTIEFAERRNLRSFYHYKYSKPGLRPQEKMTLEKDLYSILKEMLPQ